MIYKKDIAHCMGHGCPFTHKCYRNYLHHEFKRSQSADVDKYSHVYKTWGVFGDEVTHWMPIPKLPKEE